jgi:hypothetical protein
MEVDGQRHASAKTPGSHFTMIGGKNFIFNYMLNDG